MFKQWRIVFERSNGAALVHDADGGNDGIEETEEIPLTGWKIRNEAGWEEDDTLTFKEFNNTDDPFLPDMDTLYIGGMSSVQIRIVFIRIFVVVFPLNITITSSGPAAEEYPEMMGDYRMIITTVRRKQVWKKTDGDYYIFYSSIRFILL